MYWLRFVLLITMICYGVFLSLMPIETFFFLIGMLTISYGLVGGATYYFLPVVIGCCLYSYSLSIGEGSWLFAASKGLLSASALALAVGTLLGLYYLGYTVWLIWHKPREL